MYSEIPSGGILDNTQCNNQSCGIDTIHNATIKKEGSIGNKWKRTIG